MVGYSGDGSGALMTSVKSRWSGEVQCSITSNSTTSIDGDAVRAQFTQAFRALVEQVELDLANRKRDAAK